MLRHYLKTAARNAARRKAYVAVNVTGLAVGMACCILILSFIVTELSYDRYHEKADRIFRLGANLTIGGTPNAIASTNGPPAFTMVEEFPEVVNAVRVRPMRSVPVRYEDRQFYEERILYADRTIFEVFDFPLVQGDPATALRTGNSMVISEAMAAKYFGAADPMGKTLRINATTDFAVTGVFADVPRNSHFVFDMLASMETQRAQNSEFLDSWMSPFMFYNYVVLHPEADYRAVEKKFPALIEKHAGDGLRNFGLGLEFFLQPLTRIHLRSKLRHELAPNSDITYVYIFGFAALAILALACFNFTNLATAHAAVRAGEVGVRKVLGANRRVLVAQFLTESLLYSLGALILALLLVYLALPFIGDILAADTIARSEGNAAMSERTLVIRYADMPWLIPALLGLAVVVAVAAGGYPAFYLSALMPSRSLGNRVPGSRGHTWFRRVLVTLQFAVSILLLIGSGVVYRQLNHIRDVSLGFDKKNVVVLPVMSAELRSSIEPLKRELERHPGVVSTAAASHVIGRRPSGGSFRPEGYPEGEVEMMNAMSIDEDFVVTLGMKISAGRNISSHHPADLTDSVLINETAARKFGWKDPVGKRIYDTRSEQWRVVVGVIEDFYFASPHVVVSPMYLVPAPEMIRSLYVRIRPAEIPATLAYLRDKWPEFDAARPFDYTFLDAAYDQQYLAEQNLSKVFGVFSGLAVFVACLGLLGMATHTAERRTKEIGIRKLLGARVSGIVMLLSRELVALNLLANLVAWPLAFVLMHKWLEDFPLRTDLSPWLFAASGLFMLLIGFTTIALQSTRAALASPVNSLRYE